MKEDVPRSLDVRQLGLRLQDARKARGFTQQEVADHLGVARTTITAIEKGERRVQPPELIRLASLYGRSIGEFVRQGEPTAPLAVQLRASPSSHLIAEDQLAEARNEFQRLAGDYVWLEQCLDAPLPRRYPEQYLISGVTPERAAEDVALAERHRLGLGDGPLHKLREILESDVGLRVFYMDLPSQVAAMFAYTGQLGGCIAVNRKHPEERRRMSLAHDYGHFLTNRYQAEVSYVNGVQRLPEHERFAEAFARIFLMPASGLSRRFNEIKRGRGGAITPADLCIIANLYFVSLQAVTLRLEDLGLLKPGTWARLHQAGFRVREAQAQLGLTPPHVRDQVLPLRYLYLAVEAFQREELSEGQLAHLLRSDRLEARRLVETLATDKVVTNDGQVQTLDVDFDATLTAGAS